MSEGEEKPWERGSPPPLGNSPPQPSSRIIVDAKRRVKAPAVALILVGVINGCLGLMVAVMGILLGGMNLGQTEGAIGVINVVAGVVIATGGLNLLRLDNYSLVRTGSITAMVPCISICLILGLPIGVWALVVASSPDVRDAFRELRRKREKLDEF